MALHRSSSGPRFSSRVGALLSNAPDLRKATGADPNARFGPHAVEKGRVIYFVGENPDDVRCRVIGANSKRNDNPELDRIHYIPCVFDIAELREKLVSKVNEIGGADFVIVDTSAAYFLKDDENSNPQMGEHARLLRSLTKLPGDPCVLVLCHPIKYVTDQSQLLPRGGGAFIAEMDGNLTAWKHDDLVTLHHSPAKFRGPGFEPITFKLETITTTNLLDSKGRLIPTVHAVAISGQEEEEQQASAEREEDLLLAQINGKRSWAYYSDELGGRQRVVEAGQDRGRLSRMLMRPILFDPLDEVEGNWSRAQLEAMDATFVARVEAAFQAGLESRVAARATVVWNGGRQLAEEAVVESAWVWFCQRDREKEVAFSEILARCPGVDPCKVREGFARRFKQFGHEVWA